MSPAIILTPVGLHQATCDPAQPPAPILFPTNAKPALAILGIGVAVFMILWPIVYTMMIVDMIRYSIHKFNNIDSQIGAVNTSWSDH